MKKRLVKQITVLGLAVVLSSGIAVTAFAEEAASASEETVENELKTIGDAENEEAISFTLTNASGSDIKGIALKKTDGEEFGENLLQKEDIFADGESRILYLDIKGDEKATTEEEKDEEGAEELPEFSLRLTYDDEQQQELHVFPLKESTEFELHRGDNNAWLTYKDEETGEKVSTEEDEKKLTPVEEAPAYQAPVVYVQPVQPAPAADAPAADAPAADAPAADAPAADAPATDAPAADAPATDAPAADAPAAVYETGRTEVPNCDDASHGYYEIQYSDGTTGYEEY